jgi:hypothetical protein
MGFGYRAQESDAMGYSQKVYCREKVSSPREPGVDEAQFWAWRSEKKLVCLVFLSLFCQQWTAVGVLWTAGG